MRTLNSLLLFLLVVNVALANNAQILPALQQVSKHVYAWIGPHGGPSVDNKDYRMNMGFVVGGDAVAVFDTGFYP